jgi:hypothetical protein
MKEKKEVIIMTLGKRKIEEWREAVEEMLDMFEKSVNDAIANGWSVDEALEESVGWTRALVTNGKKYKIEITEFK